MSLLDQARVAAAPYITPLRVRYEALPQRDQKALLVLGVFFIGLFLVFALWWPSHQAMLKAKQRYLNSQSTLLWIQANSAQARLGSRQAGVNSGESVLSLVSNSASANGISLRRFEPEGERVRIWLEGVPFNQLAAWLNQLATQGIQASEAQLERQADSGLVSVRLSLGR